MYSIEQLKRTLEASITCHEIEVDTDGRHWFVTIVSDDFAQLNLLKRHRLVYATLAQQLQSEEIHALSLKTYTQEEWLVINSPTD